MSNKDLHNFHNELIENDSFIRWVKSEFQEDDEQWSEFIDKNPDHFDTINAAISFVRTLSFKDDSAFDDIKVWNKIAATTGLDYSEEENKVRRLFPNSFKIIALLAAACFLMVVAYRMGISSEKVVNTEMARQMTESLPDGSSIVINSASKIRYNPAKWKEARNVNLEGTAFFKVEKGNKFTVKTSLGEVTVLGTSFSVTSRDDIFEVICKTGKVAVKSTISSPDEVILSPGDRVVLEGGKLLLDPATATDENNISWLEGVYTFENQPLSEVIDEFERQFNVKISTSKDIKSLSYTGFFRNNSLDEASKSITWPLGLKYKITEKTVEIYQ